MNKHPEQPPPYGFQQPPTTMVPPMQQPQMVVITSSAVGPNPHHMTCPSCRHQISTRTETEAVTKTHLMALLLCLFCCWPCACVPYCMDSCQNINHYCPNCNSFIGTYNA